jgi:uncharacterized membrane protein YeaQ/YmgE (transglycosylase-associated protein family)
MSLVMFALWVFAGLLAGLVAGFVVNRGGYGLRWDIVLGLVGSIVGGAIYRALGIPPDAGMVSTVIVAILAAAGVIAGQRTMWPTVARDCVIQSRTWARFVRRTACRGCPALTWRSFMARIHHRGSRASGSRSASRSRRRGRVAGQPEGVDSRTQRGNEGQGEV